MYIFIRWPPWTVSLRYTRKPFVASELRMLRHHDKCRIPCELLLLSLYAYISRIPPTCACLRLLADESSYGPVNYHVVLDLLSIQERRLDAAVRAGLFGRAPLNQPEPTVCNGSHPVGGNDFGGCNPTDVCIQ